ncbi:hypothetical protein [Paenibacillus sp.]|jgi:hypothetical protein|uniref:hypothetical protein n=1 Tax=Paenibacillus sp. TaxID=58172 RepID=UPI00283AAD2C|nr:hypothetical protein [Paenibacillus sp.]
MKERPFKEKTFKDKDEINIFTSAINNAEPISGMLDYGAIFLMDIEYKDGTTRSYHLNVDKEEETTGLLVELPGTTKGYRISEETCNELRKIIYSH